MKKVVSLLIALIITLFCTSVMSAQVPQLFLFIGPDTNLAKNKILLENPYISGVQITYNWKDLEPKKGIYDFSQINKDIVFLNAMHKKLFIQLQDRSFQPNAIFIPDYILTGKEYHGGVVAQLDNPGQGKPITEGWVARVWDPAVHQRFQLLLKTLAEQFDGKIYGINLQETAVDIDLDHPALGFTPENYFNAELNDISYLRSVFHKSLVIQYMNFFSDGWNNNHHYMTRFIDFSIAHHIGLGGPDVVPYRKQQMNDSYKFLYQYKDKISVIGMAVQTADYTYTNPSTGKAFAFSDFYSFATNYLGAQIIFWNIQEPFFTTQVKPNLDKAHFAGY